MCVTANYSLIENKYRSRVENEDFLYMYIVHKKNGILLAHIGYLLPIPTIENSTQYLFK